MFATIVGTVGGLVAGFGARRVAEVVLESFTSDLDGKEEIIIKIGTWAIAGMTAAAAGSYVMRLTETLEDAVKAMKKVVKDSKKKKEVYNELEHVSIEAVETENELIFEVEVENGFDMSSDLREKIESLREMMEQSTGKPVTFKFNRAGA